MTKNFIQLITSRVLAYILVIILFTAGSVPAVGEAFPGNLHWIAHLCAYSLIAASIGLGWPTRSMLFVAAVAGLIGLIHEITEIATHHHMLEWPDVMINSLGGLIGVVLQRVLFVWGLKNR
jgi:uncharacterized membrane protein (DUF2068 family)